MARSSDAVLEAFHLPPEENKAVLRCWLFQFADVFLAGLYLEPSLRVLPVLAVTVFACPFGPMSVMGEEIQFFTTSARPLTLMFLPQPQQALVVELVQPTCP